MPGTILCTVGTSLKVNLINHSPQYKELYEKKKNEGCIALLKSIKNVSFNDRLLGAEINSLISLKDKGYVQNLTRIVLLVSETPDAEKISYLIKGFLTENSQALFNNKAEIEICVNKGLRDDNVESFKKEGLKNLVRNISRYVRTYGTREVIINATGGYKAQILYAGIIAQALGIPVYYKHELFDEIIELPPQPVSLDMSFWLEHVDTFYTLDREKDLPEEEIKNFLANKETTYLVDLVAIDSKRYCALSPTGQIFHEGFSFRFSRKAKELLPPVSTKKNEDKKITHEPKAPPDRPQGLENFIKGKIFTRPYITRAHQIHYNPDLPLKTCFRKSPKGETDQVELVYSNGKAAAKVSIYTTASKEEEASAVLADLNGLL